MGKPIKDMFLSIAEEWEKHWKEEVGLYDFLDNYIEINDDQRTYIIRKRKKKTDIL
ncbi:MAG: hypothetical protein ACE5NL_02325 [Candidatus Hydrothermarchaeaceae archaeon]